MTAQNMQSFYLYLIRGEKREKKEKAGEDKAKEMEAEYKKEEKEWGYFRCHPLAINQMFLKSSSTDSTALSWFLSLSVIYKTAHLRVNAFTPWLTHPQTFFLSPSFIFQLL